MPEPIFSKTVSSQLSENTQGEKCDPPLQRLEELEAKGRDLQMRISSLNATVTAKSSTLPTTGVISLSRPAPLSKQTSFIYSAPSSLDQVRAWVEEKLEYPSAQDQERWEVLEKLDQLQKEVRIKSKELQNNFYAKGNVQSNEIDDDNEAKTVISTATEQTISTQTSSAPSTFSRLSSVLSFSGRTQVNNTNTKKPVLPLSTISETSEESQEIGKTQDFQNPLKQLEQLLNQIDELNSKYLKLIDDAEKERCSDSELGQEGAISFNKEEERDYAWEKADTQCVAVLQKRREREELQKIALEQKKSWQLNTKRWELRVQADETYEKYEQAQQDAVKCAEEAGKIRGKTKGQQEKDNKKWKEASEEAEKLREIYLAAEEKWEKKAQEYSDEYLGQRDTQEQANERLKERDRAVNKRWEKLLKSYQNPESEESVVEQDIIAYRIMDLEKNLNQAFRGSIKNTNDRGAALIHYRDQALRYALIDACDYPEELKEAWEKMSVSTERIDKDQQKINKEAAEVFLKEVKRFEKIEKIWKGVLKEKQDQAKQKQDEAVQEYYRGNYFDWNNLSEEERERYNSEVEKANEEYEQKITEAKELNNKKIEIETNIKQIEEKEKKSWNLLGTHKQKRQEKLKYYRQQLEVLKHLIQKTPEQLKEQKAFLNIGKRARPKEKAYEALLQSQRIKEKKEAKEGDENSCWNKAATCYLQANTRWEKAAYDKGDNTISEEKHKKNEKIALSYEKAAESYEKAVPENDALNGKKNLIQLYGEAAKLYEQLAKQLEKEEVKTDTFEIEETLYQLEKKIELYLTSFGVQIEELQENIPLLQNRLEEMGKKVISLRSPNKEILGVKQEAVIADLRELIGTCQKALEDLLQEVPESGARAAKAIASIQTQQIKAQQVQITIEQTGQLEVEILSLEIKQKMLQAHVEGENFVDKGQKKLLKQCDPLLFEARTVQNDLIRQSEGGSDLLAYFQSCMDKLQQFKEQDQYLQQITPQLQSLEHDKAILEKRYTTLENDIKVSKNQGEIFIAQGQEKLLENAKKLISKINITSRDLLAKAEKAFEQKENLLHLIDQFHKEEEELYFKIASLRELDKHKNHFQNLKKVLSKKIAASKNQGEIFFKEAQQQLLNEINQRFPEIEKTTTQIIKGDNNSSEETNILLLQLEQLEQRYQVLKNNASILLSLGEKKNFLQDRLKNLTEESKVPLNEWKTYLNNRWRSYLNESQEYIVSDMTQLLLQIDPIAKQLIAGQSKDLEAAQSLLTQLEQFIQRDQLFQQNSPYLGKLDEIKNLFQNYVEIINRELDPARDRQELLVLQRKQLEEFSQMLAKIDHTAKQLLPSSLIITTKEQLNILFNEIDLLKQKYQYNIQVKNFLQKENYLKYRAKVLESEMTVSIGQGETVLSQRQQTLLVEINNALQQSALMVDKILSKDNIENNLTMPLFYLDQLLDKDKKLQKEFLYLKRQDV
ncbi:MAG: hypothetical protein A3F67_09245 [Verrucomicrobia bacterium RIFCSPHIGHO2_12_FULL_41_10]|nr:MAG: hypothetical protein A3F67_09245 [Verrucomicrobia bacterium RIFCSPHIGHO2_12_FULL_41_10]